jgi:hypothetical protein
VRAYKGELPACPALLRKLFARAAKKSLQVKPADVRVRPNSLSTDK